MNSVITCTRIHQSGKYTSIKITDKLNISISLTYYVCSFKGGSVLTLYHTISAFNDPVIKKNNNMKTMLEMEKMLATSIFPLFKQCFLILPIKNINFPVTFILSSANAFK